MSAPELLPCPFCGGEAVISRAGGNDERSGYRATWLVTCLMCPSKTSATDIMNKNGWSIAKEGETKARAIANWNRRTDLSQTAVAAALEAAAHQAEDERKSRDKGYDTTDYAGVKLAAVIRDRIRALITPAQHDALAAHVAAEVAKARAEAYLDGYGAAVSDVEAMRASDGLLRGQSLIVSGLKISLTKMNAKIGAKP